MFFDPAKLSRAANPANLLIGTSAALQTKRAISGLAGLATARAADFSIPGTGLADSQNSQAANDTADRHRLWLVTLPTGDRISVSRTPPATVAEIQRDYPGAQVEPEVEPIPAHPLEGETLDIAHALLRHWDEDDPVMIQEWLDGLAQDPDKLRQMRDEAERLGITRTAHGAEDRIVCLNCAALEYDGKCGAARRGDLPGFAPWYAPDIRQRHRCIGFQPKPDDPDQRPGRERWPNLYLRSFEGMA